MYFGVAIDSAVNLLEAREYANLDRAARLRAALAEQQQFLGSLLGHAGYAAFDLRIQANPERPLPIEVTLLGRVWDTDPESAIRAASEVRRQLHRSLPTHVVASVISDSGDVQRRLDPYGGRPVRDAMITKQEVIGAPSRPDAGRTWYFSVLPLSRAEADWTPVYEILASCAVPLVISVAVFPAIVTSAVRHELARCATYYGRLAREDQQAGGLYYGARRLPPDAFAVEAERAFADYLRRCSQAAFVVRIQVTGPDLPVGVVEALSSAISPPDGGLGSDLERQHAGAGTEVRWFTDGWGQQAARWNLAALDCVLAPGRPEIWRRPDRLGSPFELLSLLGDATDAACAFRFPVAVDGVVPGFAVRRGRFGHAEAYGGSGPGVTIGHLARSPGQVQLPLRALTKHALVAGSTGSGKTTTVLELLSDLWLRHRIPFLVIEPVNAEADDYRRLLNTPGFDTLKVFTVGDENTTPLRFNPFQVPNGVLVAEHIANLLACFKAAFGLWEPLPSIYQQALDTTYLSAGILASEVPDARPRRWPTAVDFSRAMAAVTADLGYAGDVGEH